MNFERSIAAIVAVAFITLMWVFRWEVTPLQHGDGAGGAYMVNRWTGTAYFLYGATSREVVPAIKPPAEVGDGAWWKKSPLTEPK